MSYRGTILTNYNIISLVHCCLVNTPQMTDVLLFSCNSSVLLLLLLLSTFVERTFAGCHKCAKEAATR